MVGLCFQSLSWVTNKSAVKCPFWEKWKQRWQKQVNLVKDSIKRNNRLAYKFWESLLLPCRTQWKRLAGWEIEGRQTLTCYCWSFHEVSLSFSSTDLRSPRSLMRTSKMSEPRIARWQVTVCCHWILKSHKYFTHCVPWYWDCGWHYFKQKKTSQKTVRWRDTKRYWLEIKKKKYGRVSSINVCSLCWPCGISIPRQPACVKEKLCFKRPL